MLGILIFLKKIFPEILNVVLLTDHSFFFFWPFVSIYLGNCFACELTADRHIVARSWGACGGEANLRIPVRGQSMESFLVSPPFPYSRITKSLGLWSPLGLLVMDWLPGYCLDLAHSSFLLTDFHCHLREFRIPSFLALMSLTFSVYSLVSEA